MELSFAGITSVKAGRLAEELELALLKAGAPPQALSLIRSSPQNMDFGTILGIDVHAVAQVLGSIGYIACFVKCIHEVVSKHHVTIVITTEKGSVEIPASEVKADIIEKAITQKPEPEH
jgi:hypothetical protein